MFDKNKWDKNEWIEDKIVQEHFKMTFSECIKKFGHCRSAEWCKYPYEGQKITNYFRKNK